MSSRALLAVGLFAGFYLTGLALAAALAWLPWAQARYTGEVDPAGLLAAAGALYVLWALVPPRSKWQAPGPELTRSGQPRLHSLIGRVARDARHPLPTEVYLTESANAFAGSRPRWLGLRREPILGLGLPLFAFLTEREWTAVLAHEFGHHAAGDVRLGPWQHGTHRAIAAALQRLDGSNVFLHLPFYAYGRLFLRVTGSASREQELRADALAARLSGRESLGGALVALEHHAPIWTAYWHGVFLPAVEAGFLPPILDGYRRYLAATRQGRAEDRAPTQPPPPEPDDTHPPLRARLAALGLTPRAHDEERQPATGLLEDQGVEERLIAGLLVDPARLPALARIGWEEWGDRVLPVVWEHALGGRLDALRPRPLSSLPELLADERGVWEWLRAGVNVYSDEARQRQVRWWLSVWAALSLLRAGFRVRSGPGAEPVLERGNVRVKPFQCVEDLAAGRPGAEWKAAVDAAAEQR